MDSLIENIKTASIKIKDLIENGDLGKSEQQNSTGDTQLKLDIESDKIIQDIFFKNNSIKQIVSEEQENILDINTQGKYLIAYDPLDGSSLVDVNLSVGSIYGIYQNSFSGENIIGAVYVVFGPRVEMVVAIDDVKLYRLYNNEFRYIKDISLNNQGKLNATGATQKGWSKRHKEMVDYIFSLGYRLRYSGGMVPDLHQILLKGGGLFSYPGTSDKPKGKLRQLFEVFPFAFVYEKANGEAIDGKNRLLDIQTNHIHDTTPCFFGSKFEIDLVKRYYANN